MYYMKIEKIKEQFERILKNDIIKYINKNDLVRKHPNYPSINSIKLTPNNITLDDDKIDSLNDGKSVLINCYISGQYTKVKGDGNLSAPNSFFTLSVIELIIIIEDEQLIIKKCDCFASVD